jgi:hypothetical protein
MLNLVGNRLTSSAADEVIANARRCGLPFEPASESPCGLVAAAVKWVSPVLMPMLMAVPGLWDVPGGSGAPFSSALIAVALSATRRT